MMTIPAKAYSIGLGLLLGFFCMTLPATAQTQYLVMGGVSLTDDDEEQFSTTNTAFAVSLQRSLNGLLDARLGVIFAGTGPPPCPEPPGVRGEWNIKLGNAIGGSLDLTLPLSMGDRLRIEPFVGGGFRYTNGGEIDQQTDNPLAAESSLRPLISAGGSIYLRLGNHLDGVAQVRGSQHFLGEQTLTNLDGATTETDLGNVTSASLLFGLAFRL